MATHGEMIMELETELRGASGGFFGGHGERDALQLQIDRLRFEWQWYGAQVDKGLELVEHGLHRRLAQTHLNGELAGHQDLATRLRIWRAWLVGEGYLNSDQAATIEIKVPVHPPTVEAQRAWARRDAAMKAGVEAVLVAARSRQDALKHFNRIQGPCSAGKIGSWLRDCVTAGCLPEEYLPMRGAGRRILKSLEVK